MTWSVTKVSAIAGQSMSNPQIVRLFIPLNREDDPVIKRVARQGSASEN
jgi:hypothetical protein